MTGAMIFEAAKRPKIYRKKDYQYIQYHSLLIRKYWHITEYMNRVLVGKRFNLANA